jgi:hypothetical protein
MSRIVPATEAAIDPAHPRRLEKKTNISYRIGCAAKIRPLWLLM